MKTILIVICLLIPIFSHAQWVTQTSGTSNHLRSIFFVNDMTGWAVGYSGTIIKTTNGGTTWFPQTSGSSNIFNSVFFVSSLTGWAAGSEGDIRVTGNGGTTWTLQSSGITSGLFSLYFFSASTGWAVGGFMEILKTTNAGVNWTELLSGSINLNSVFFTSATVGFVAGDNAYIMKTTSGGTNWSVNYSNTSYNLYSIHFPPGITTTGYAVGAGTATPPMLKTTDSGESWFLLSNPPGEALASVYFTNAATGWAAGALGTVMRTTNGGTNWTFQTSGTSNYLRSIYFINSSTGWAAGELGTIIKTTTGGSPIGIHISGSESPEEFSLEQNYPNPFNPVTKIKMQIPKMGWVNLTTFDVLGKELDILVNEQLNPGTYEIDWNASNNPSGVYFYRLTAGDYCQTRKMVLLK